MSMFVDCQSAGTPPLDTRLQGLAAWQERLAKEVMLQHLERGISVSQVASVCGLSRSHFTRQFKLSTGLAPLEWLRQERILRAQRLLAERALPLAAIALECGFFDQAHLSRVFTRSLGLPPLAWQQQALERRLLAELPQMQSQHRQQAVA
ncbi:AraC family transcriptional regulator [uncultured Pseudomonas sp.]|uniref:AraC family transcriptional regulator n=1 Tax=uncultured Pseudomonas sp. TaxID=114707 RepID=UPI003414CEC6